jgi:hypothetical protein
MSHIDQTGRLRPETLDTRASPHLGALFLFRGVGLMGRNLQLKIVV